jgi:hypothetical protein
MHAYLCKDLNLNLRLTGSLSEQTSRVILLVDKRLLLGMASPLPQMTQIYALSTSESLSVTEPPTAIGSPTTDLCIDRPELEEHKVIFDTHMRNKPVKHKHVHVLIWTWAEALDDLNVKFEVSENSESSYPRIKTNTASLGRSTAEGFQKHVWI